MSSPFATGRPPPGGPSSVASTPVSSRAVTCVSYRLVSSPALKFPVAGLQLERLDLQELLQAEPAQLPPVAGLLVAAERRHRVEGAPVDLHLPGAQPAGDRLRPLRVAPPHAAGQGVQQIGRASCRERRRNKCE